MESNQHQDHIRYLYVELLAWLISRHVECKLEDRHEVDWFTAAAYVDAKAHEDKLAYLMNVTTATISREAFHQRFFDMAQNAINTMITSRTQWLSPTYYQ